MAEKYTWRQQLGEFLAIGGELLFWLTWWLPVGLFLGGDPTMFGTFYSELEVIFPISGMGIVFWWLGQLILSPKLNPQKIVFPLLWLLAWGANTLFSLDPATSVSYLLVWGAGLLALGTQETFFAVGVRRIFFGIGLIAGFIAVHWFPMVSVSSTLLSIGAVWGLIFLAWEPSFRGKFFWQLLFLMGVFYTENLAIQLVALLVLVFGRRWFGVASGKKSPFWLALMVWGLIFGWQMSVNGPFLFHIQPYWTQIFSDWTQLFLGVGEGQFLVGLQQFSPVLLDSFQLRIPDSGAILTFFEHGAVGVILLVALLLFSNSNRPPFLSWWLLFFWIFSPVFIAREEGIIFMLVLLATQIPRERAKEKIVSRIQRRRKMSGRPRTISTAKVTDLPES
jgi:hypothetical protein